MSGRFVVKYFILILFHELIDVWTFVNLHVAILCSFFYKINGISTRSGGFGGLGVACCL
jgi:hypothetical protein